jgi:hypothetical protein
MVYKKYPEMQPLQLLIFTQEEHPFEQTTHILDEIK